MPLMVWPKKVDYFIEPPVKLIAMISRIRHEIGVFTIAADDNAILIVPEVGHPEPRRVFRFIEILLVPKELENLLRLSARADCLLACPDIKPNAEAFQGCLLLREDVRNAPVAEERYPFASIKP